MATFALRQEHDTTNPMLAVPYGRQITAGILAYYDQINGETVLISLLGEGEMDGCERVYYNGTLIPEFNQYGQRNWKFHPGTYTDKALGFTDPVQGRPEILNNLDFTFSGIAYIELKVPADFVEEGADPDKLKIMVRGRRVYDYNTTGGAGYTLIPGTTVYRSNAKVYSNNNALVAADILTSFAKITDDRIDWESIVAFKNRCAEPITWHASGSGWHAQYFSDDYWGNLVTERTEETVNFNWSVYNQPPTNSGSNWFSARYTTKLKPTVSGNYTFYITHDDVGRFFIDNDPKMDGGIGTQSYTQFLNANQVYELKVEHNQAVGPAYCTLEWEGPGIARNVIPASRTTPHGRDIPRFSADVVFPQSVDAITALEAVMLRAPGVHWQDVSGIDGKSRISFLITPERPVVHTFVYDPTQTTVKSNIVNGSFSAWRKATEDKPNFLRFSFRDSEQEFYSRAYSYADRPQLRDESDQLIDPGIIDLGVCDQSLADRIAETQMRTLSDLDLYVSIKGQAGAFHVAKGDVVELAHDVPGWTAAEPVQFIVVSESFESSIETADERSFELQLYNPNFYSDADQGPIQGLIRNTNIGNPAIPPSYATGLSLTEGVRLLPDGTSVPLINGQVTVAPHPYRQQIQIWIKRPGDADFIVAPIPPLIHDPATSESLTMPFTVEVGNGVHYIRAVAASMAGNALTPTFDHKTVSIAVSGATAGTPASPLTLSRSYSNGVVLWQWTPSSDDLFVDFYELRDADTNEVIFRGDTLSHVEAVKTGAMNRRVYAHTPTGGYSLTGAYNTFTLSTPSAVTGFDINLAGDTILETWNPNADTEEIDRYEISAVSNFSTKIWSGKVTQNGEPVGTNTGSRAFTRYIRAVNSYGVPSTPASVTKTFAAPGRPTLSTIVGYPSSVDVRLTPPVGINVGSIVRTVIEISTSAGFGTILETIKSPGMVETVTITGRSNLGTNGQVFVRAYYEDVFGAGLTSNDGYSYTFTKFVGNDIGLGQIVTTHLVDDIITAAKLADNAVEPAHITVNAVTTEKIAPLAVTNGLLAANAVDSAKIANDAVVAGKIAAGAVNTTQLVNGAVTNAVLAANAVATGNIQSLAITNALIAANAVQTGNIASGAVTNALLAGSAVDTAKLANDAVIAGKIANGAVVADKIAANAVTSDKVAANAIIAGKIAAGVITANEIATGTITALQIAANTITAGQIASGTITAGQIAANTITAAKIAAGTITAAEIAALTITGDRIAANTIVAAKLVAGTITSNEIATGTIVANNIASSAVTADKINAGAVIADKIAANAVTSDKIAANSIIAGKIAAGVITAAEIAGSTITGDKIAANTITAGNIAANTITAGKIAAGTITANEIAASTISGDKIAANAISAGHIVGRTISADKIILGSLTSAEIADGAIGDSELNTASSVLRNAQNKVQTVISGGGQITWNGTALTWTARFIVIPTALSSSGYFEFGANTVNIGAWEALYYRTAVGGVNNVATANIAYNAAASGWFVAPYGTMANFVTPVGYTDWLIAIRNSDQNTLTLFDGRILSAGQVVESARFIPNGSIVANHMTAGSIIASAIAADAVIAGKIAADAVTARELSANSVTAAKIVAGAVTADKISANNGDFGIVVANAVLSKDYQRYSTNAVHSEQAIFMKKIGCAVSLDGGIIKTANTTAWDSGASSTRGIFRGEGYVEITCDSQVNKNRMFGLSYADSNSSFTDLAAAWFLNADGFLEIYMGGTQVWYGGLTYTKGTILRVAIVYISGIPYFRFYRNDMNTHVYQRRADLASGNPAGTLVQYPMRADISLHSVGASLPTIYIYGVISDATRNSPAVNWLSYNNGAVIRADKDFDVVNANTSTFFARSAETIVGGDCFLEFTGPAQPTNTQGWTAGFSSVNGAIIFGVHQSTNGVVHAYANGGYVSLGTAYPTSGTPNTYRVAIENGLFVLRINGYEAAAYVGPAASGYPLQATVSQAVNHNTNTGVTLRMPGNIHWCQMSSEGNGWKLHPQQGSSSIGQGEFNEGVVIRNTTITEAFGKAAGSINRDGVYKGRDSNLPNSAEWIAVQRYKKHVEDDEVFVTIKFDTSLADADLKNVDSAEFMRVRVFNKFNEEVTNQEFPWRRRGICFADYFNRYFCDPIHEAVFSFEIYNSYGYSRRFWFTNAAWVTASGFNTTWVNRGQTSPTVWMSKSVCPSNLSALASTHTIVTLNWTPPTSASHQMAYYRAFGTTNWTQLANTGVVGQGASNLAANTNSLIVSNLSPYTAYEFMIHGSNGWSWSNITSVRTFPPPLTPPQLTAPSGLNTSAPGQSSIDMNWSNGTPTAQTEVYRSTDNNSFALVHTAAAGVNTWSDSGLSAGTTYYYKLRHNNGSITSDFSNTSSSTTQAPPPPPNIPHSLSASPSGSYAVYLNWSNPSGQYTQIWLSTDGSYFEYWDGASAPPYTVTYGIQAGATYWFKVTNDGVNFSNVASVTTDPYIPPDPDPWCVALNALVPVWTRAGVQYKMAMDVKLKDYVLNGKGQPSRLASIKQGWTTRLYTIITELGKSVQCSPSHPVITSKDDTTGVPAYKLQPGQEVLVYHNGEVIVDKVAAIEYLDEEVPVVTFSMEDNEHTYIAGDIVSHNRKQDPILQ